MSLRVEYRPDPPKGPAHDPQAVVALLRDLDRLHTDLNLHYGGGPRLTIADVIERVEQMRLRWRASRLPESSSAAVVPGARPDRGRPSARPPTDPRGPDGARSASEGHLSRA